MLALDLLNSCSILLSLSGTLWLCMFSFITLSKIILVVACFKGYKIIPCHSYINFCPVTGIMFFFVEKTQSTFAFHFIA
jgi:hypothetical protein